MAHQVWVVGAGPGSGDYLTPAASQAIAQADTLIGGQRLLSGLGSATEKQIVLGADLDPALEYIRERWRQEQICVLVSGDPGLFSLLPKVIEVVGKEAVEVIPGLSSVQLAFARFCETWEDAVILSLHGRNSRHNAPLARRLIQQAKDAPKLALLTEARFPPPQIADFLLVHGVPNRQVLVAQDLSYPEEILITTDLQCLARIQDLNRPGIMILSEVINEPKG